MPRKPRILTDSGIYHIVTRGNNRQNLFKKAADYQFYLNLLQEFKSVYSFDLYHYCLMTNHTHLLMKFYDQESLQKVMQRVNLNFAKWYKRTYRYHGHVFQDRFKSLPIDKDAYLLECGRYIERNPLKARMVTDLQDYPWSSYSFYAHGIPSKLLTLNPCYENLGKHQEDRQCQYRNFLQVEQPYDNLIGTGLLKN